ncbi:hypothetical protein [Clostridium tertium]|uniref:hypothetical protein n=1 Tax=Clostridium tertium TaxID=1559 RepID=UPI0023B20D29|nr:hypothetical protein [Clostridium tertium]
MTPLMIGIWVSGVTLYGVFQILGNNTGSGKNFNVKTMARTIKKRADLDNNV